MRQSRRCTALTAVLGAVLAGCSSSPLSTPAPSLTALFNQAKATDTSATATAPDQPEFECPSVGIRGGAATLSVSANPAEEASAMNLRYQVGISETARECKLAAGTVTMRVGVQGRVVLGPAGAPGQIDLPLRLALVHEGPEPKTIFTKLYRVPVAIPPGSGNVPYTMIEEDISFPMPPRGVIDEYIIYVGFDPQGLREPRRPARGRRR